MLLQTGDNVSLSVGGLGECTNDFVIAVSRRIACEILGKHGIKTRGVNFTNDLKLFMKILKDLEQYNSGGWFPGGSISNTMFSIGVCQGMMNSKIKLNWFGVVGNRNYVIDSMPDPVAAMRRVSITPYCVYNEKYDELTICIIDCETRETLVILAYSNKKKAYRKLDWPGMDILIIMLRDIMSKDNNLIKFVETNRAIAIVVGDYAEIDGQGLKYLADIAATGKLKWIAGRYEELLKLSIIDHDGKNCALQSVEIIGTKGLDPVRIWDPSIKNYIDLRVPSITLEEGSSLGAGDAYFGGYLYGRLMGMPIEEAHEIALKMSKSVLQAINARCQLEEDLNALFGSNIQRSSEAFNEGVLFSRVRITPGITIISGGQTGVDQIALKVAAKLGLPAFGVLPKGRRTEVTEKIVVGPDEFGDSYLTEIGSTSYRYRTWVTAFLGDGTLIWDFYKSEGSVATKDACIALGRPYLDITEMNSELTIGIVNKWIDRHNIRIVNIAGNRGSLLTNTQKCNVEKEMLYVLQSAAFHKVQSRICHQEEQKLYRLSGNNPLIVSPSHVLKIGFPNVSDQKDLFVRFLHDTYGVVIEKSRKLILKFDIANIEVVFARPRDLTSMLKKGAVNLIFCGRDLLIEDGISTEIYMDTGLYLTFIVLIAIVEQTDDNLHKLRICSQYPLLAPKILSTLGYKGFVTEIHGTSESWINSGIADAAIDSWRTGATVEENGLLLWKVFQESSLVVASLASQVDDANFNLESFLKKFRQWLSSDNYHEYLFGSENKLE